MKDREELVKQPKFSIIVPVYKVEGMCGFSVGTGRIQRSDGDSADR